VPADLIQLTDQGFYCAMGDFYVDPWRPVARAVITHAHADHFARECGSYLVADEGESVFRVRLGGSANIQTANYSEKTMVNGVTVSLHPAGHILGSAQVRVEHNGEVWVISGDYNNAGHSRTCTPFETVKCHTFVTEATFALPIYHWQPEAEVYADLNAWWRANREAGRASIVYAYALGKAQRVLAGLDPDIGPIFTHGAVEGINRAYRTAGTDLPPTTYVTAHMERTHKPDWKGALVIAPLSARGTTWVRKFGNSSSAFVSGWMQIRGARRRRAVDRGFVMSDHADWNGLLRAIKETGAERVGVTHGYVPVLVRYLREQGYDAASYDTRYQVNDDDSGDSDDDV
jgi:putative mRNA 3-end processing factor